MDSSALSANLINSETATATSSVNAFWFSFTYYVRPALLEGVMSA
jgi:hypothetical protein